MNALNILREFMLDPSESVGNVVIFLMFAWFCSKILKNRNPVLTTLLGVLINGILAPAFLPVLLPQPFTFIAALLVFWIYLDLSFEASKKEKVLAYCIGYSAINLMMFLTLSMLGLFKADVDPTSLEVLYCYSVLSMCALFMATKIWRSIEIIMKTPHFWGFFLMPVSQFAMVIVSVLIFAKSSESNMFNIILEKRWVALLYIAVFGLSLLADGFFLEGLKRMATDIETRERLQTLEAENQMTYDYIKSMESDVTEMRRYRHDLLNLLTAVQLMIDDGAEESRAAASDFVQNMTHEISELTGRRYCGCNIVNCLLDHEETKLTEAGISCDFRAEIPDELCVNEIDLCRIISNLLDNARECCELLGEESEKNVYFNMRVVDDYLYISMRNTRPAGRLNFETQKEGKGRRHGLGLNIVRDITERCGGALAIAEDETSVTFTATLEWKPKHS